MVVTPGNGTLIVAESFARRLTAFDIAADGSLANRRVWADVTGDGSGYVAVAPVVHVGSTHRHRADV
jgi:sugar lactone lactonase YvrE